VALFDFRLCLPGWGDLFVEALVALVEVSCEAAEALSLEWSCVFGEEARGLAFKRFADDVVARDFADCRHLDTGSGPGSTLNEAFRFEALEGGGDRDGADSEEEGEFPVAKRTARWQFAIEDAHAQFLVGLLS